MEYKTLNNGLKMPMVGLGVYNIPERETQRVVEDALSVGYRSIDTAAMYYNEKGVGDAVKASAIPREQLFITTKMIKDWNQELTPWAAPPVFGKVPFGNGAGNTLEFITNQLLPEVQENIPHLILGGYSLAGLFALWAGYQTDKFEGIAAASPSVWYPQWIDYASENKPLAKSIYLSLGDKEEKAKNPIMAQVGNAIRKQHELLTGQELNSILEWNVGNHFVDSDKRMAKGFAWTINNL